MSSSATVSAPTLKTSIPERSTSGGGANLETAAAPKQKRSRRRLLLGVIGAAVLAGGAVWYFLNAGYETTDDAFVNSYVTYVSPRVAGNVVEVRVDDNQFVEAGQVLLRLDAEPYRIVRDQKLAALDRAKLRIDQQVAALRAAEAEVEQARNQVRSQVVSLWSNLYLLQTIQSIVRYQEAGLKINLANEKLQHANLVLAEKEHGRYSELARPRRYVTVLIHVVGFIAPSPS